MGIYDRDWYRERHGNEQKSPYVDNRKISREDAESVRIMMEGNSKHSGRHKSRGLSIKLSSFIIFTVVIGYVIAVGYNIMTIDSSLANEDFMSKNNLPVTMEVASRLGFAQSLAILSQAMSSRDVAAIWQDSRVVREAVNVLYDWYAPIKWSAVLGVSKEVGWFFINNRLNISNNRNRTNPPSSSNFAYVNSNGLNVRSGPSVDNRVVTTLTMNTRVQVLDSSGQWWRIRFGNIEGYVNSEFLRK